MMDYIYEQLKHYKGDSRRSLHGIFPYTSESKNSIIREIKFLEIDDDLTNKLSSLIENRVLHEDQNEAETVLIEDILTDEMTIRERLQEEIRSLFRHMDRNHQTNPGIPQRMHYRGVKNKKLLTNLFDKLGIHYTEEEALIFRDTHYFRVVLNTNEVFIHFTDDEEKYASICLRPIDIGWSNTGYTDFELSLISKITSILFNELPMEINDQINNFLTNERSGANLFIRHNIEETEADLDIDPRGGTLGLRDEMLRELARLRRTMSEREENNVDYNDLSEPISRFSLRAQLQNELKALFRAMRNEN